MSVEFAVAEDEPPVTPHSIYSDLVNLPDPLKLGLTVRIFNYDSITLYMRVDGYDGAWTFTSNDLGGIASGGNSYFNLDQFGTRAKPAAETEETITVRLRAYTDAGYTILKWTYERVIDLVFIKSDDGSWTQDVLNNFDDGTVQGWAFTLEAGSASAFTVITDYVLSVPYSLYWSAWQTSGEARGRVAKTFATPNRNKVYAIIDVRLYSHVDAGTGAYLKYIVIRKDSDVLLFCGRPYDTVSALYLPINRWLRFVVPLPKNTSVSVRIAVDVRGGSYYNAFEARMDDFRIISKD